MLYITEGTIKMMLLMISTISILEIYISERMFWKMRLILKLLTGSLIVMMPVFTEVGCRKMKSLYFDGETSALLKRGS